MNVLVLGSRGAVGRHVVAELTSRGHAVRTLTRREGADLRDADTVSRAAADQQAIVNCAGASVALGFGRGWRGYRAVDVPIGMATIEAARRTGARLVYVGAFHQAASVRRCAYIDAHERVAEAMTEVDGVVVRSTGFYSAFQPMQALAKRGLLVDVGKGTSRTNPIAEMDLAKVIANATVVTDGPRAIEAGGPEVLSRREIFERIAASVDRRVRIMGMPVWLARVGVAMTRVVHPRIGQFGAFATLLARHDAVAPAVGTITFADYLAGRIDEPAPVLASAS